MVISLSLFMDTRFSRYDVLIGLLSTGEVITVAAETDRGKRSEIKNKNGTKIYSFFKLNSPFCIIYVKKYA